MSLLNRFYDVQFKFNQYSQTILIIIKKNLNTTRLAWVGPSVGLKAVNPRFQTVGRHPPEHQ